MTENPRPERGRYDHHPANTAETAPFISTACPFLRHLTKITRFFEVSNLHRRYQRLTVSRYPTTQDPSAPVSWLETEPPHSPAIIKGARHSSSFDKVDLIQAKEQTGRPAVPRHRNIMPRTDRTSRSSRLPG